VRGSAGVAGGAVTNAEDLVSATEAGAMSGFLAGGAVENLQSRE
jgi:hypothetical protein